MIATVNPYLSNRNSIVYNVVNLTDGWRIEVSLPKHVPPSDKVKVIDWLYNYRNQIRKTHPLWSTAFRVLDEGYILEVRRGHDIATVSEMGNQLRFAWNDTIYA